MAGAPFSASFEKWSASRDSELLAGQPSIRWIRDVDGSTEIVERTPRLFDTFNIEVHFVSDISRRALTGFATAEGPLSALVVGISGLGDERTLLNGDDPFDTMPLRPGDREDGSPRGRRRIALQGVEQWTLEEFQKGAVSNEAMEIRGRTWATKKHSFRSPDEIGELHVWFSEELNILLREELRAGGELERTYRATALEARSDIVVPFLDASPE